MSLPIAIREAVASDMHFVWGAWRASLLSRFPWRTMGATGRVALTERIKTICSQSTVLVACDLEDEDTLFGFVVFSELATHYVYVKESDRDFGIAHLLLTRAPRTTSVMPPRHGSEQVDAVLKRLGWEFNPFTGGINGA